MHGNTLGLGLRTLPSAGTGDTSRAERERLAKQYWDRLTPEQEVWVLRKMRFAEMGRPRTAACCSRS